MTNINTENKDVKRYKNKNGDIVDESGNIIKRKVILTNCKFCDERVSIKAKKCKHCGELLDDNMREIEELKKIQLASDNNLIINNNNNNSGGGYRMPHLFHFIMTILTGGLWLVVWIIHGLLNSGK